jgi:hypothetical protein
METKSYKSLSEKEAIDIRAQYKYLRVNKRMKNKDACKLLGIAEQTGSRYYKELGLHRLSKAEINEIANKRPPDSLENFLLLLKRLSPEKLKGLQPEIKHYYQPF